MGCGGTFPVDEAALEIARARADQAQLISALNTIEDWHDSNGTGLIAHLNPGATAETVAAAPGSTGVKPSEELLTLWSWHNGESSEHPYYVE